MSLMAEQVQNIPNLAAKMAILLWNSVHIFPWGVGNSQLDEILAQAKEEVSDR